MKRYEFNKLVRNKLPSRMQTEGVIIDGKQLSEAEYKYQLKRKLLEETTEVTKATNLNKIKLELADVLEVINALASSYNISLEDIEQERVKKREINGYFTSENYINFIEVSLDNQKVIDYLEDDDRAYKYENKK